MKYAMRKTILTALLIVISSVVTSAQEIAPNTRIQRHLKEGITPPAGAVAIIETKVVSTKEFTDALHARFATHKAGLQALENLVSRKVIAKHLKDRALTVTDAEVNAEYASLDARIKEQTKGANDMASILASEKMTKSSMMELLRTTCALEKLAGKDFGKKKPSKVEQEQWLRSKTKDAQVVVDLTKLPENAAAKVYDSFVTKEEFTGNILLILDHEEAIKLVEAIMQAKLAGMVCAQADVKIESPDIDRVYGIIKANFEADPRYEGLKFADFVKERYGMEPVAHKASANFQREVCITCYGEKIVTDESAEELYAKNLDFFGPTYELRHIIIRGSDDPKLKDKLPSMAAAKKMADDVKTRIDSGGMNFEEAARMFSQDARTKFKNGAWDTFTPARLREIKGGGEILALKEKQMTSPLPFAGGYRIIKLESKSPVAPLSPRIATELRKQTSRAVFNSAWKKAKRGYDLTKLMK
ncbi:MAG: parvulin-like peptidyl-prolyl isomerase [Planctomycetota bacterium]|jgi:parvulin-like peptidyl-prolyl isomerase